MASAMNTVAPQRYRAVVKFKKVGPDTNAQRRDDMRNTAWIQPNLDTWEGRWAQDDSTVGQETEVIYGHYDTITPVKHAMKKGIRRKGNNYKVLSVEFQIAPLVWQPCDENGVVL